MPIIAAPSVACDAPHGERGYDAGKPEQTMEALTISRRLKTDDESLRHVSAAALLFASMTRHPASITMGGHFPDRLSTVLNSVAARIAPQNGRHHDGAAEFERGIADADLGSCTRVGACALNTPRVQWNFLFT